MRSLSTSALGQPSETKDILGAIDEGSMIDEKEPERKQIRRLACQVCRLPARSTVIFKADVLKGHRLVIYKRALSRSSKNFLRPTPPR